MCPKEHNPLLKAQYQSDIKIDPSKFLDNEHLLSLSQFLKRRDQSSVGWNHRICSVHPLTEKVQNLVGLHTPYLLDINVGDPPVLISSHWIRNHRRILLLFNGC